MLDEFRGTFTVNKHFLDRESPTNARTSTHNTVVSASKKLSLIDRKIGKIVDGQRSAELMTATATVSDHWDRGESEYVQSLRQPFDNTP